jgi:hypothetical protein
MKDQINELDYKMKLNKDKVFDLNNSIKSIGGINCGWKP